MPLPEDEQRQLQQIERALYGDDPRFGRLMRAGGPRVRYERRLLQALLGVVAGAGMLAAGAVIHGVYLGAAGAVIVLLALAGAVAGWRRYAARLRPAHPGGTRTAKGTKRLPGRARQARMMERMEERWRRRQEGNGGMPGRARS